MIQSFQDWFFRPRGFADGKTNPQGLHGSETNPKGIAALNPGLRVRELPWVTPLTDPLNPERVASGTDFIERQLRSEKSMVFALEIPPVARELLAGGLQEVPRRTGNHVARNRAFDVDAHKPFCKIIGLTLSLSNVKC